MYAWMLSGLLRLACTLGERSSDGAERRFVPRRLTKLEASRDRSDGDLFQQLSGVMAVVGVVRATFQAAFSSASLARSTSRSGAPARRDRARPCEGAGRREGVYVTDALGKSALFEKVRQTNRGKVGLL
jgi:hypothetical protein